MAKVAQVSEFKLPDGREEQLALLAQLIDPEKGGLLEPQDVQGIVGGTRDKATTVIGGGAETATENPALARYHVDYAKWDAGMKAKCTWEEVSKRLLANNGHFLQLVLAMHQGGVLFGVDEHGNPLVADKGKDPMDLPHCGLNYPNTLQAVMFTKNEKGEDVSTGYEMFPETYIRKFEESSGHRFVASNNGREWRGAWLDSGENPGWPRDASFSPVYQVVGVFSVYPRNGYPYRGVRRLLRVTKF